MGMSNEQGSERPVHQVDQDGRDLSAKTDLCHALVAGNAQSSVKFDHGKPKQIEET
jgi:hypothetical protein